jgi:outer membrane lipoprotein SlyB
MKMKWKPELKNNGVIWAGVLTGLIGQIADTAAYMKGRMKKDEFAVQTAENVTSALGVIAGIEYGAMLGSAVLPGAGTVAGSILGGFLGDRLGRYVGHQTGKIVYNQPIIKVKADQVSVNNNVGCSEQTN